ncbi:MAG: N-acetyltransferase family protein [Xenococcaceae cyanobacterium]
MTVSIADPAKTTIRPLQYRDLDAVDALQAVNLEDSQSFFTGEKFSSDSRSWQNLRKFWSLIPSFYSKGLRIYVAEQKQTIIGLIQVSPFNNTRSTWRVEKVLLNPNAVPMELLTGQKTVGSQLVRHCLEKIWEARTWILEVNINQKNHLALYRENGFQPIAQMTYWAIAPELLAQLAQQEPELPNLLPVSNADAQLLYQLDCMSMPPLLRQVFDRHIQDFKTNLFQTAANQLKQWLEGSNVVSGYVFEPQRKAAIAYFKLELFKKGDRPHRAELTVNPAYTWLYPQLLAQMAQLAQELPPQSLELTSADYQSEREEYLEQIGASRLEHTLLMSRSVWHKIKETKPLEGLQLSEVLQGLKPARTPIPSRMSWLKSMSQSYQQPNKNQDIYPQAESSPSEEQPSSDSSQHPGNGHHA